MDAADNVISGLQRPAKSFAVEKADIKYYRDEKKAVLPSIDLDTVILAGIVQGIREGSQSVHDTAVQNTTKTLFKALNADDGADCEAHADGSHADGSHADETPVAVLYFAAKSDMPPSQVADVRFVLSQLAERDASIYNLDGKTEMQVLDTIWQSGNELVRRQLLNELVDCKKDEGEIYCPTGVVTRLMNATAIEAPEKMARTTDTLRTEMMNIAIKVRDENAGASEDRLKELLTATYKKTYDGVVSHELVQKELDTWLEHI